jgi:HlyD family secretion protein
MISPMSAAGAKHAHRRWLVIPGVGLLGLCGFLLNHSMRGGHAGIANAAPAERAPEKVGVSCLGRIQPDGDVIRVAAPAVLGRPPVVEQLAAKEGERIGRGQLVAILSGRTQLEAALGQARAQVGVARRRIDRIKSGAKNSDLAAQRAEIARIEVNLRSAQSDLERYEKLRQTDDVTQADLDRRRATVASEQAALEQARHRLSALSETPESEVRLAEAQLQAALADEQKAQREYESSEVHAPMSGQVLKIHAHAGEEVGQKGILEMARTERMYVVAEVYETDIGRVRPGQNAEISGDLLAHPLKGVVERLGMRVMPASVLPGDPTSFSDNRVIEVRIRLIESAAVAGLIDGKVSVVIRP